LLGLLDTDKFVPLTSNSLLNGFAVLQNGSLMIDSSKLNLKSKTSFVQCVADNQIKDPLRKTIKIMLIGELIPH